MFGRRRDRDRPGAPYKRDGGDKTALSQGPVGGEPGGTMYNWVKTVVGALLAVNFSVPLYTVASNRHLWDEPMAMLAGNMSLACALDGLIIMLIGIYDLVQLNITALCRSFQYIGFGFGIAFKAGQVCMALDQFVAVFYPLRHFPIMMRFRPWMFAATWLMWGVQIVLGLFVNILDLETFADNVLDRINSTLLFPECRWESSLADVYTIVFELQLITFSMATACLLIYTAVADTGSRSSSSRRSGARATSSPARRTKSSSTQLSSCPCYVSPPFILPFSGNVSRPSAQEVNGCSCVTLLTKDRCDWSFF